MCCVGCELLVSVWVVEGGNDLMCWEFVLVDLVDSGDYDIVLVGIFIMVFYVQWLVGEFLCMCFVMFDVVVDYVCCVCGNVYFILFCQNEGVYLVGYLVVMLLQEWLLLGLFINVGLGQVGGM